jgi:hypothetical protein
MVAAAPGACSATRFRTPRVGPAAGGARAGR